MIHITIPPPIAIDVLRNTIVKGFEIEHRVSNYCLIDKDIEIRVLNKSKSWLVVSCSVDEHKLNCATRWCSWFWRLSEQRASSDIQA